MNPTIQAVLKAKSDLAAYAAVPADAYHGVASQFAELPFAAPSTPPRTEGLTALAK